ncbi:MAG: ribonuclease HI [Bacteroidales bacterium]|nr:ribonuclease HI [Bacteroidales bacterium]MBQ7214338.1 ribonuclease HI [Bacteroidales bacterium]MBR3286787.1 ribonuclease HI [Bacteroidales bacterium]
MMPVTIYTDGSALGNPGKGGYGVVLLANMDDPDPARRFRKELSQGYRMTTNNRMELMAAIVALEALRFDATPVNLITDSRYVCEAVNKEWVFGWEKKNFEKRKNADLWRRFLQVYRRHQVRMIWVKGHDGNVENERCDRLAVAAANGVQLLEDTGYMQGL